MLSSLLFISALVINSSKDLELKELTAQPSQSAQEILFKNRSYHFSFSIPADWKKQSGNPHGDNVMFTQMPISDSCSFQFNITQMAATFPVEATVHTGLNAAYRLVKARKLLSAKRRDTVLTEKTKQKNKEIEKTITLTRGWEITEQPQPQSLQKIIYQAYDRDNRYFNFVASATSEKFLACAEKLHKIIDSISFLPV